MIEFTEKEMCYILHCVKKQTRINDPDRVKLMISISEKIINEMSNSYNNASSYTDTLVFQKD